MNLFKTTALLGLLSGLLTLTGYLLTHSTIGAVSGLAIAIFFNFTAWFYSDQIALAAYGAKKPNAHQEQFLQPMVQRLCDRADLPLPKIYVLPTKAANAFATGRDPQHSAIAVTQGLLDLLTDAELEAVIAHELSHILHRDTLTQTIAATIAGGITLMAELLGYGWFGGSRRTSPLGWAGLLFGVVLAPFAAGVIQMAISRTREFAADAGAARLTGNPNALADALARLSKQQQPLQVNTAFTPLLIVNPLSGSTFNRLFSTHPPTEARVEQLRRLDLL